MNSPLRQRAKTPLERATEAALAYAEAETDEEFSIARECLRKSIAACAPVAQAEVTRELVGRLTREALARLKAEGVRLGPPRKVEPDEVTETVAMAGSIAKAAVILRVSVRTVFRALRETRSGARSPLT